MITMLVPDTIELRSIGVEGVRTVREHTLALLLVAARRLHELRDAQAERRLAAHLGGIQPLFDASAFGSLIGAQVVKRGFGSIGQRLAGYLRVMEARVTGIVRSAGERDGVPVVGPEGVDEALAAADALVMILPSLPSAQKILDAEWLSRLPQHARLVNVGRGATVDEDALIAALPAGSSAGAALDVDATEPLPGDAPLLTMPQVIISPHAAGGWPMDAEPVVGGEPAASAERQAAAQPGRT